MKKNKERQAGNGTKPNVRRRTCQWLDDGGCQCKKKAVHKEAIFGSGMYNNEWFHVWLCNEHQKG